MNELTIETLERMFTYLGCANIATQHAMDGAIPLECFASKDSEFIAEFDWNDIASMPIDWRTRFIWFSGMELNLGTACNVHWSTIYRAIRPAVARLRQSGQISDSMQITAGVDAYFQLYYSVIDSYGRFVKFPVNRKKRDGLIVNKLYNPSWIFSLHSETLHCLASDNDELYKERKLSFLATFSLGLQQSVRTYWRVKTKFDSACPALTLLTDPIGVREFWKLRDIPEGKRRRDALLHWVEDHWRQRRNDPDTETFVRKHIRGSRTIKQGAFSAVIEPSEKDCLEIEIAKKNRDELRLKKTDTRRREALLRKVRK